MSARSGRPKDSDKSQSDRLKDYLDDYSVKIEMNSLYSHNAVTLKRDISKMVITMQSTAAKGKHVSYNQFIANRNCENDENLEMLQEGSHFNFVERSSGNDVFITKNRRFFGKLYDSHPIFSPD